MPITYHAFVCHLGDLFKARTVRERFDDPSNPRIVRANLVLYARVFLKRLGHAWSDPRYFSRPRIHRGRLSGAFVTEHRNVFAGKQPTNGPGDALVNANGANRPIRPKRGAGAGRS